MGPVESFPKGPCTQIVYTLAPKYLYRDYFKDKEYTIWVHGPFGFPKSPISREIGALCPLTVVVTGW